MQTQTKPTRNKENQTLKTNQLKVAKRYATDIEYHQTYIDILARLAGYRLSDMNINILAYLSYYGKLSKNIKEEIANKNNTSVQVISNGISRLRKLGLIIKSNVHPKLVPKDRETVELLLVLKVENEK